MELRCLRRGSNKSITVGTVYELVDLSDTRFTILNDNGVQKNYAKNLFEVIPEVPVVPPVTIIDELNIETNVNINGADISFNVTCPFIGRNRFSYNSQGTMSWSGTAISCGIYQIQGVDALINRLQTLRTNFENYLRDHSTTFVLNNDINLDETFKDIYVSILQDLIAQFQGAGRRCGMLLLSTTTQSVNSLENFREALTEISENVSIIVNPNSRNEIQLWTLLVTAE